MRAVFWLSSVFVSIESEAWLSPVGIAPRRMVRRGVPEDESEDKKLDDLFAALAAEEDDDVRLEVLRSDDKPFADEIEDEKTEDKEFVDRVFLRPEEEEVGEEAEGSKVEEVVASMLAPAIEEYRETGMVEDERIGNVASHTLLEVDEDGDPVVDRARMVFVDEATCIGCTNCACIAPQTFMMEDMHGRARAFRQDGDTEETIEEAIATCPVDCIHWVPWDELVSLEAQREEVMPNYNFKGRLVGNDGFLSGSSVLDISTNNAMRCSNCPTNKCPDCPMFSVGDESTMAAIKEGKQRKQCGSCPTNGCPGCPLAAENPEFQKRRARRDIKRRQRIKNKQRDIRRDLDLDGGSSQSVDL